MSDSEFERINNYRSLTFYAHNKEEAKLMWEHRPWKEDRVMYLDEKGDFVEYKGEKL